MVSNKIKALIIAVIILIIGIFYLLTIREGHDWGGDFSMYTHHAKNIAEGIDYKDTGYIYNPFYLSLAPKTYPPIFPLLLLPIYKWFGLDLTAMKIEIILFFLASLFIIIFTFRNELPFPYLITIITLIGVNPFFWNFKDCILSDIPFLFFLYFSLCLIHRAYQNNEPQRAKLFNAVVVGLVIYLSYGTRSIGVVLIPCLFIYDIIESKWPPRFAIIATLIFVFFMTLQTIFLHSDAGYFVQFSINPKVIFSNLFSYTRLLSVLWFTGFSKNFRLVLFAVVYTLAVIGYLTRIKDRITIFEIFPLLYIIPLIIWPAIQGTRYLIPVIPLYIFYVFVGVKRITFFQHKKIERYILVLLIGFIFVSYADTYANIDYGPIEGITKKETIELFRYISENTDEGDVFIFLKPRVLSLFTGRKASVYHQPHNGKDFWDYVHKIGATYFVVIRKHKSFLYFFVKKYRDNFEEMFSNSDFEVYRIKDVLRLNGG